MSNEIKVGGLGFFDLLVIVIVGVALHGALDGIKREVQLLRESVERTERAEHPQPKGHYEP